jgi:serine phosphatase RsbU (regulator of sigma subunit)
LLAVSHISKNMQKPGLKSTLLFLLFYGISSLLYAQSGQSARLDEKSARVKAAYIYKFTDKIFWPGEDQMRSFNICVLSSPALLAQLSSLEEKVKFRKRIPIKVMECKSAADINNCQMLVIDGSGNQNLWSMYTKIRGKGVLMITENLADYKKSMISFVISGNKLKYIINKTKMQESNLVVKDELYTFAITKEGEWNSIFEKFNAFLESADKEVQVDKSDIAQFMSEYKSLENEKSAKEAVIRRMEDSLNKKIESLREKIAEYDKLNDKIELQKTILARQSLQMENQKKAIDLRDLEIGKQQTVIIVVAALSCLILLLLLLAIRVNGQRRKANKLLSLQKNEIERQKHLVEEKQKEILDSITYAKRIQTALMSSESTFSNNLPEHFIVFKPKDIVAGDFFWAAPVDGSFIYITADSTGHGVPGAFMSLLNISKLNEAVNQKNITRPDLVLNDVKQGLIKALNPEGSTEISKDGMDATLCRLDLRTNKLQYAAANNSFCIVRNREVINCQADKMPIGKSHDDDTAFTFNEIHLEKGDMIYTFTDGYPDQFGGPSGKKLKHKHLKQLLSEASVLPVSKQKELFDQQFEAWKGSLEQVDDVLLIGIRI